MNSETAGSITSAETCNGRKRKRVDSTAHGEAERLQTVQEGEETPARGRSPSVSVPPDRLQQPITPSELTELLHYAALGKSGGVKQPSWCRLHHQKRVKAVNVVIVDGLTQSLFYQHYLALRHLRTSYTTRVTFTPSATDLASEIFSGEVPESDDSSLHQRPSGSSGLHKELRIHPVITKFGTQRKGLTAYVLTQEEMIRKHYPVKGMPRFEDFVCSDSVDCVTDSSPLYGLDCEMCLTAKGNELTRVSLVNSDGKCLLDLLVKPQTRILNYLTKFSGITRAMLRPITTTLREVQVKLGTLLPSDAVLVGHSIENDLVALKLIHKHVIDTALLYRRNFGQKFKLKVLAESVLKRQIQTEGDKGHDPIEDAVAALDLAKYFIKMGPLQVVELHLEELWGCTIGEESSESESESEPEPSLRFADVLQAHRRSVAFFGKRSYLPLDLSNQQWHNSDREVVASYRKRTKCPFLSVLQFPSLSNHLRSCPPPREHPRAPAILRDMCVVFAGPFPAGFSKRDVSRLFCCCGPVRNVKMLTTTVRVHAEVEFELLEGASLALKALDGLHMQGQAIKVQRPVYESMLDLDLTLEALMCDGLNASHLYAVKFSPGVAEGARVSARTNGHASADAERPGVASARARAADGSPPARVNGASALEASGASRLTEETIRETFGRFGSVERVVLPAKQGKRARHAYIQFESSAGKHAALSSSEDLRQEDYLVCPSLTPAHLPSWVAATDADAEAAAAAAGGEERTHEQTSSQYQEMDLMMRKLNRRLRKIFRFLPEGTLSVVVLLGDTSAHGHLPGLCFMEVKQR